MEEFQYRIRICRLKKRVKQSDVARDTGIAYSTYCRYEQGGTIPDLATAAKLADYFGVSLDYLAGRTDKEA